MMNLDRPCSPDYHLVIERDDSIPWVHCGVKRVRAYPDDETALRWVREMEQEDAGHWQAWRQELSRGGIPDDELETEVRKTLQFAYRTEYYYCAVCDRFTLTAFRIAEDLGVDLDDVLDLIRDDFGDEVAEYERSVAERWLSEA